MPIPLERADTEYEFDPISTQAWVEIAQIERDALNPAPQAQQLERADTEYDFDPISTQALKEIAQIERDALNPAPIGNTEASLRSPLQDGAATIGENEGNMEDIERSGIIQYLKPGWDYSDINDKILSAISQGTVACILGHYETRSALWSPKTCFDELGIKPQFEVTVDDGVSRSVLLQLYDSENI